MKAILAFNLPRESQDHLYALHGVDALLVIEDLLSAIREKLKHQSGPLREWTAEVYDEATDSFQPRTVTACDTTLERVREILCEFRATRRLPELE